MRSMIKEIRRGSSIAKGVSFQPGRSLLWYLLIIFLLGFPQILLAESTTSEPITNEEAIRLGEEFGIIVGEVDEEIQEFLGLEKPEGVVVFEVIGGKPAALAGIKPRALIKEINSIEIRNLKDFGIALQAALPTKNFTVATYEPADPNDQGISGGINFHFVRGVEKI